MQKSFTIMLTDLRIFFADRGNLVGLLVIPAVLTIVLGSLSGGGGGGGSLSVAVLDLDQSDLSAQFISEVEVANPQFEISLSTESREAALELVSDGDTDALFIIPEGFAAAVQSYAPIQIDFYSNEEMNSPSAIQQSIAAVMGRWNGAIVAERVGSSVAANINGELEAGAIYERANAILAAQPVRYDYVVAAEEDGGTTGFTQAVPGMGSMFVLFTVLGGLTALVKERQQWTMQRLVVLPLSRAELLAGKILGFFVLGMLQYAVVILIGAVFGMSFGSSILAFVLVAAAFALCATALSLALATRIRTEGQAGQLTTLLSLALASLGGAWWPLEIVPDFMKVVGHFSPVAWAMDGFHDLLFYGGGLVDVLPEVGILLAISAVLFGIGIWGFRYE
jgi:ABC-2 type transport system permease protein